MRIGDSSSEQSDAMADTPPLTWRFVHPSVSPSFTAGPSATPDVEMLALPPGQKDKLCRVMIEPDRSSWHPAKDAVRALKDCVRRFYTHAYHSWSEIPNSICQTMFNEFKTICTWELRYNFVIGTTFERRASARLSSWLKKISLRQCLNNPKRLEAVLRVAHCTPEVQRPLEQLQEMEKELGRTPIEPEVFKKTHVKKKENELDLDVWVEERAERTFNEFHQYVAENLDSSVQMTPELSTQIWKEKVVWGTHKGRVYGLGSRYDVRRLQSGLEGIGSSRQAEALDSVQIAAMSAQITQLTSALTESEQIRVVEQ